MDRTVPSSGGSHFLSESSLHAFLCQQLVVLLAGKPFFLLFLFLFLFAFFFCALRRYSFALHKRVFVVLTQCVSCAFCYFFQVDVVDSEYSILQRDIATASDFQSVLRAHKTFTSNMLRLSLIDNTSVQEGIERILQVCLRFIAVCRIQHQVEDNQQSPSHPDDDASRSFRTTVPAREHQALLQSLPIYVPPEELGFIRKDFFAQVTLLFQLMRKVESRGFIFRLDFNSFLSNSALDSN